MAVVLPAAGSGFCNDLGADDDLVPFPASDDLLGDHSDGLVKLQFQPWRSLLALILICVPAYLVFSHACSLG